MQPTVRIVAILCFFAGFTAHQLAESIPLRWKRAFSYIANETACTVDHIVFRDGDPIPTDDPCEVCKCRPPGFACVLRECEIKTGCRAFRRIGECCPQYQCGCEHDGKYYQDGERIPNAESPCYSCYCQGSSITCSLADCKFRFDCEPEYIIGECCPRYDHCPPEFNSVTVKSTEIPLLTTLAFNQSLVSTPSTTTTAATTTTTEASTTIKMNKVITTLPPPTEKINATTMSTTTVLNLADLPLTTPSTTTISTIREIVVSTTSDPTTLSIQSTTNLPTTSTVVDNISSITTFDSITTTSTTTTTLAPTTIVTEMETTTGLTTDKTMNTITTENFTASNLVTNETIEVIKDETTTSLIQLLNETKTNLKIENILSGSTISPTFISTETQQWVGDKQDANNITTISPMQTLNPINEPSMTTTPSSSLDSIMNNTTLELATERLQTIENDTIILQTEATVYNPSPSINLTEEVLNINEAIPLLTTTTTTTTEKSTTDEVFDFGQGVTNPPPIEFSDIFMLTEFPLNEMNITPSPPVNVDLAEVNSRMNVTEVANASIETTTTMDNVNDLINGVNNLTIPSSMTTPSTLNEERIQTELLTTYSSLIDNTVVTTTGAATSKPVLNQMTTLSNTLEADSQPDTTSTPTTTTNVVSV